MNGRRWRVWRSVAPILIVAGGAAVWIALGPAGDRNLDMLVDELTAIRQTPGAPILIMAVLAGLFVLSVPILPVASAVGLAFGAAAAVTYVLIAGYAAALILFGLGRRLGRPAVQRYAGPKIKGLDARLGRHGLLTIVLLRFTPLMPFFVINLLAGSSRIRLRDFIAGTVLGLTPTVVGFAFVGGSVQAILTDPTFATGLTFAGGVAAFGALVWVMRGWARRRKIDKLQAADDGPDFDDEDVEDVEEVADVVDG